jgi:hypothetical protein
VNAFNGKRIQPLAHELNRTLTQLELLSNNGAHVKQPPAPNEAGLRDCEAQAWCRLSLQG